MGLDRDEVKREVMKRWGVAHLNELNKEQYAILDGELIAAPSQVPSVTPPSLGSTVDATPVEGAATSQECLDILAAIDLAKGKADMTPLQSRIEALENDDEREECTKAYNWQIAQLKKKAKGAL